MREIKFKAKRIDNGEWVYGKLYECDKFARIITAFAYTNEDGENDGLGQYYCEAYDVKIDTICQFTGLYDKNGKEIYENDLLIDCLDGENIFKVIYEDGCFKFKTKYINSPISQKIVNDCDLIIIGNIFDNKELLGEQQ